MIFNPTEIQRATIYLTKLFERGKKVKIEPITRAKTISQNNYTWLVFTHIAQETGNIKEDIYQFCLKEFPTFKEIEINGEIHSVPVTLSGFTKEQTSFFIDCFVTFFRQEGIDIPSPEDKKCMEMYSFYRERGIL